MTVRAVCWLVLCTIPCGQLAYAKERLHIYTENFVPYNYIRDNEIVGINIELVKKACVIAKLDCTFELLSWPRAFKFAQHNSMSGLVSVSRTPEREPLFKWVGPLVFGQACLYKLKRRSEIPVLEKRQLKNYTIGLIRNDVYQSIFNGWGLVENDDYLVYSERYEDIKAFVAGRLDLILASNYTLAHYLEPTSISIDEVEPVFHIEDYDLGGNYLALNLATKPKLRASLQRALETIPLHQIDELIKQYVPSSDRLNTRKGSVKGCF